MIGFAAKELGLKAALDGGRESAVARHRRPGGRGRGHGGRGGHRQRGPLRAAACETPRDGGHDPAGPMWLGPLVARRHRRPRRVCCRRSARPAGGRRGRGHRRGPLQVRRGALVRRRPGAGAERPSIALGALVFWRRLDVACAGGARRLRLPHRAREGLRACWSWPCCSSAKRFTGHAPERPAAALPADRGGHAGGAGVAHPAVRGRAADAGAGLATSTPGRPSSPRSSLAARRWR